MAFSHLFISFYFIPPSSYTQLGKQYFESPCTLRIIGSIGGLICFTAIHDQQYKDLLSKIIIFNPEIGHFLIIPTPLQSMKSWPVVKGFGFDDTTMDYKIFLAEPDRYVYIYSLNSSSWRLISCQNTWYERPSPAIFVKGCFHWMAYDYAVHPRAENPPFIVVFDIKSETFGRILFQEPMVGMLRVIAGFGESSIGVVQQLCTYPAYVWIMEQNGSWLKIIEAVYEGNGRRVLGFKNKDELLVRFLNSDIVSQNVKNNEVRDVIKTEIMSYCCTMHAHVP